jgi:hypothetical protein
MPIILVFSKLRPLNQREILGDVQKTPLASYSEGMYYNFNLILIM